MNQWLKFLDGKSEAEIFATSQPKRRKTENPEWKLQVACVKLVRARMKVDKDLRFIAPMAEGQRSMVRAAISKLMGMERGVADVILLKRRGGRVVIDWCELKREGGRLSPEQKDWFAWFEGTEIRTHRIDNIADFATVLHAA